MDTADLKPRRSRFGEYTVVGRLGEGGMCHVFRARRHGASFDCALKLLKREHLGDERIRDLFVTEADIALMLHHPNLIATYDAGEINGRLYIAMELIEGSTLDELIDRCIKSAVVIPIDFALFIISQILEGLQSLHSVKGKTGRELALIHRDVTPHNIFLSYEGRVVLGDFGIAQIKGFGGVQPAEAVGKIGYLSPEMVVGEEVDRRSDLFSAGIVLHELLTATRLFSSGSDDEIMAAIAEAKLVRPRRIRPSISRGLEGVILKALARRSKDRYENAAEFLGELEPYWSKKLGAPDAIAALMSGIFHDEAAAWRSGQGIRASSDPAWQSIDLAPPKP